MKQTAQRNGDTEEKVKKANENLIIKQCYNNTTRVILIILALIVHYISTFRVIFCANMTACIFN